MAVSRSDGGQELAAGERAGHLLLDSSGRVNGRDRKFQQLFAVSENAVLQDADIDAIFPAGFRPRDLIAGIAPENPARCVLGSAPGQRLRATLKLEPMGECWLLAIFADAEDAITLPGRVIPPPAAQSAFLADLHTTRSDIARYLHDTVCQSLVALSLSLARMQSDPGLESMPALLLAADWCDTSSHDLRCLMEILSSPLSSHEDDCVVSDLSCYVRHLREDAGVNVRFEGVFGTAGSGGGADLSLATDPIAASLISAALQRWAEAAMNQSACDGDPEASTRISLRQSPNDTEFQFLNARHGDAAIEALLTSALIIDGVRATGGSLAPIPGQTGSSALLRIGPVRTSQRESGGTRAA